MKVTNFEAGHIISHAKGGEDNIDNLLPICSLCNKSMGTENLIDYKLKYYSNKIKNDYSIIEFTIYTSYNHLLYFRFFFTYNFRR